MTDPAPANGLTSIARFVRPSGGLARWLFVAGGCAGVVALLLVRSELTGSQAELAGAAALGVGLITLQALGSSLLVQLLIPTLFVTRFRVEIAGYHFLPEHFVVVALIAALLIEGKLKSIWRVATDRTALALALFVAWQGLVSLAQSPDPHQSLAIVGWFALDWLLLVGVVTALRDPARLEWLAVSSNALLASLAVGLGLAFLIGGGTLGTTGGYGDGERAVFAVAWEPNLLASVIAVWAFVGLSSPYDRARRIGIYALPVAIAAIAFSITRAVIAAFALGVLVWGALAGRRVLRPALGALAGVACAAVLTLSIFPSLEANQQSSASQSGGGGPRVPNTSREASISYRWDAAKTAVSDLGPTSVVTGLGTDSFGQRHEDPTLPGQHQPWYLSVLPLQVLYDGGLIAIALLAYALVSLRPLARPGRARALGVLTIYVVAAAATSPFWFGWSWLLIALALITRPADGTPAVGDAVPGPT